jgi:hypothetical protein
VKVLILTVGGSHQPILRSIEQNQPDLVHFLCSGDTQRTKGSYTQVEGVGKVLKSRPDLAQPDLPNIVTLARLPNEKFKVHKIPHFDDLNECYLVCSNLIKEVHKASPEASVVVDYTGGTKSMTAGLAAAALDDGRCEIQLVTGVRADLTKVKDATEFAKPVRVWDAQMKRRMEAARGLIARFDYAAAGRALEEAATRFASEETIDKLKRWISFCRAFDAWDKFDHSTASELLHPYRGHFDDYKMFLAWMLNGKGHGFEVVEDLVMNADRRASQERYDDATARLYRALELAAQVWLKNRYNIYESGNVPIPVLPEDLKKRIPGEDFEKGTTALPLLRAWDFIAAHNDDPLSELFRQHRQTLLSFLKIRNESILAHGLSPVAQEAFQVHGAVAKAFIEEVILTATENRKVTRGQSLPQLPNEWE